MCQLPHQHDNPVETQCQRWASVQCLWPILQTPQREHPTKRIYYINRISFCHEIYKHMTNACLTVSRMCGFQVNRPLTMKKDGIQTRNRKVSSKSRKGKRNCLPETDFYAHISRGPVSEQHTDSFSLGPAPFLSYNHSSHIIPSSPPSLHPAVSLSYPYHPNASLMPTLVGEARVW